MSIKISFKKNIPSKYIKNYVLFVNENFKINGLSKIQLQKDSNFIYQVIRSSVTKKKNYALTRMHLQCLQRRMHVTFE